MLSTQRKVDFQDVQKAEMHLQKIEKKYIYSVMVSKKSRMIIKNKKAGKLLEFSFSYVYQTFVPEGESQFASRCFFLCEERAESLSLVAMTTQNTR